MQTIGRSGVYDGKIAGLYDLEETLGVGHFAVVKLARHVFTGEKVAVKVIDKTKLDEVSRAHLFQEVRCMKLVQHPNVVRLYEVIDTQTKLYLILELGDGGDLYDYIMKHEGGLNEHLAKEYFRQIVRAISYCHQLHVVHRDLKPENVLFFEKLGVVKLTDFGFSNKFCPGQKLETSCGSLAYSAPEILLGDSYDAPAVDVWSLGVILFMLVCGHPPFQEANDSETLTMIMDCKYTTPAHVSDECRDLIARMLLREPEKRATLNEIAKDKWLAQNDDDDIVPEYLPLVSRHQVSEDDHTLIIQKMVNGNIATKDEISEALDKNEYNHITATYFLLAERRLKLSQPEQAPLRRPISNITNNNNRLVLMKPSNDVVDGSTGINSTNFLTLPSATCNNNAKTGNADGATGRSRKCSIVQEESDDDEEEEQNDDSLNRRGSKSEGRINLTVQERIAETERSKIECAKVLITAAAPARSIFEGICNVKVLTASDMDPNRLGKMRPLGQNWVSQRPTNLQNANIITNENVFSASIQPPSPSPLATMDMHFETTTDTQQSSNGVRSYPLDQSIIGNGCENKRLIETKFLTDSATITLPLSTQPPVTLVNPPKYKTMPSPTRVNTILSGGMCLNEIFEEGTDVGSSDTSTTTTPRPLVRHITNNRSSSQTGGAHTHHRRSKFNKSRTASCSSSDDDDSENRKKRAHKIVDSTKPFQMHRRDSNDDSSDSQDPSNSACGGGGGGSGSTTATIATQIIANNSESTEQTTGNPSQTNETQNTNGRQKSVQGFRRHRTGRRSGRNLLNNETRLRESQSLNRITEVQESELPASIQHPNRSPATLSTMSAIEHNNNDPQSPTTSTHSTILPAPSNSNAKSSKFNFGARLLHGFRKSDSNSSNLNHAQNGTKDSSVPKPNESKSTKHQTNNNKSNNNNNKHHLNNSNKCNWNHETMTTANSNETINWSMKHSKPPLRVKAQQRLKNLKCLVDIFS